MGLSDTGKVNLKGCVTDLYQRQDLNVLKEPEFLLPDWAVG